MMAPLVIGVVLLAISGIGWSQDPTQFYFSYLVGWVFCISIALGSLFFVLAQHLTKARWSVVVRRIPEALMWTFPLLALLGIPFVLGTHDLYHCTHSDVVAADPLLSKKTWWLNEPFFYGRVAFYFASWMILTHKLYKLSIKQDVDPDPTIPAQMRKVSAWGLPLFAVTASFAAFDILMSLDPHWFSTIFGVYFFAGGFLSALCVITLVSLAFQKRGDMLQGIVTKEHYQDLGKFMFGFTVFWAYIGFSQYMLIWYANIPEETIWFRHRLEHGWEYHSAVLLIFHFILPFIILLPRWTKRSPGILGTMAVWLLIMQWFDLHWLVMPILDLARDGHAGFHWTDFTCWLGLTGIFVGLFMYRISRHSLVPQNDPYLKQSLRFMNT